MAFSLPPIPKVETWQIKDDAARRALEVLRDWLAQVKLELERQ